VCPIYTYVLIISGIAYNSYLQSITIGYEHSLEGSCGMKRWIWCAPPMIALRFLVRASCSSICLVNMSATILSMGKYLNLIVPCSAWPLRKCHFKPMRLVFSLPKAFREYTMALWLSSHMVVVPVMGALKVSP
jgi:hypothetical protein